MTPRRWLELSVGGLSAEEGAHLVEGLLALGARSVWEDAGRWITHFPDRGDGDALLERARRVLADLEGLPTLDIDTSWRDHEDWAATWRRGLGPRRIANRLVVTPTWESPVTRPGDVVIELDPGVAFGTAAHGTTRGCLRLLERAVTSGSRVLDVGAGSGILSIAAAKLGATEVVALEGDELALGALAENVERNGSADRVRIRPGWSDARALGSLGAFDVVAANLEVGRLLPLLEALVHAVDAPGWLVAGGMTVQERTSIEVALGELGVQPRAVEIDDGWCSLLLRRSGGAKT